MEGDTGYVIDQYLLPIVPAIKETSTMFGLGMQVESIDTIYKGPIFTDGSGVNFKLKKR